tara:strand:+ start:470 stop:661 length:192 start_codon:yes stop_codon:yes gene_type:complete
MGKIIAGLPAGEIYGINSTEIKLYLHTIVNMIIPNPVISSRKCTELDFHNFNIHKKLDFDKNV